MTNWFHTLFGVDEGDYDSTQAMFEVAGDQLVCKPSGRQFTVGTFATPTLQSLRQQCSDIPDTSGRTKLSVAFGDVSALICDRSNRFATFQVPCRCSPSVTRLDLCSH